MSLPVGPNGFPLYETLILCLETSTEVCSAALFGDTTLLGCQEYVGQKLHGRLITAIVEQLFANLELAPANLTAVAVSEGPGSYTGLRIGVSAAKGLCVALDIPLIAVPTLEALAAQVKDEAKYLNALICPMLDARRMEVYHALYTPDLNLLRKAEPLILAADSFAEQLGHQPVIFLGSGAAKYRPLLDGQPNAVFRSALYCTARSMGALAYKYLAASSFADEIRFEPVYLKEVNAVRPVK